MALQRLYGEVPVEWEGQEEMLLNEPTDLLVFVKLNALDGLEGSAFTFSNDNQENFVSKMLDF